MKMLAAAAATEKVENYALSREAQNFGSSQK
jgi:hypothetical protein